MDITIVDTMTGKLSGTEQNGIYVFKGIPYGAPTGGKRRFMPPEQPSPWTGVRDASKYGHQSPQNMRHIEMLAPQADAIIEGYSEDCLCLNVWTPGLNTNSKRPVMFWCHGGGFDQDSGSWPWIDGENLSRRGDVVVVTINHRLNVFGYFHLGDVGGEKYASSGNVGMLDLVAGLQWVRDNIATFGGDPGNVMIFGESGGGAKVSTLLAMPIARGLFHRAALQSGISIRFTSREQANELTEKMFKELGMKIADIDTLQSMPVERLMLAMGRVLANYHGASPLPFSPVLDGKILLSHPFSPVATSISDTIPLLVGCNTHEESFMAVSMNDEAVFNLDDVQLQQRVIDLIGKNNAAYVIKTYKRIHPGKNPTELYFLLTTDRWMRMKAITLAERKFLQGKAPVYLYSFAWRTPVMGGVLGAPHTVEIPFVFYNTDIPKMMTKGGPEVKELSGKISDAWIHFARSGNPNHKGLPKWSEYNLSDRATMVFDTDCKAVNDLGHSERELWDDIKLEMQ
jgi:para-nitrobenzyl esterase